jgi:hypothetical protein
MPGALSQSIGRGPPRWGANRNSIACPLVTRLGSMTNAEFVPVARLSAPMGGMGPLYASAPQIKAPTFQGTFAIVGTTRDSAGAALAGCYVTLAIPAQFAIEQATVSDGSGNFKFVVGSNGALYQIIAYKAGAPDVGGASINTAYGVLQ